MSQMARDLEPIDAQLEALRQAIDNVQHQIAHTPFVVHATPGAASANPEHPADLDELAGKAAAIYAGRRARDKVFAGVDVFGEPVWDILLDLFVAHVEDRQISFSSAVIGAAVAPTTALRWISTLVQMDLLERVPDPSDPRRAFIRLTDEGVARTAKAVARARA